MASGSHDWHSSFLSTQGRKGRPGLPGPAGENGTAGDPGDPVSTCDIVYVACNWASVSEPHTRLSVFNVCMVRW